MRAASASGRSRMVAVLQVWVVVTWLGGCRVLFDDGRKIAVAFVDVLPCSRAQARMSAAGLCGSPCGDTVPFRTWLQGALDCSWRDLPA